MTTRRPVVLVCPSAKRPTCLCLARHHAHTICRQRPHSRFTGRSEKLPRRAPARRVRERRHVRVRLPHGTRHCARWRWSHFLPAAYRGCEAAAGAADHSQRTGISSRTSEMCVTDGTRLGVMYGLSRLVISSRIALQDRRVQSLVDELDRAVAALETAVGAKGQWPLRN